MNAKFYDLIWKKGEPAKVVQGIKGNKRPKKAIRGDRGSFLVAGEPAHLYLYVKGENGKIYKNDVYLKVLKQTNRQRMSEKLFNHVYEIFESEQFKVDAETGEINWTCKL